MAAQGATPGRPGHAVLMGMAARRYYLDGRSKVDIAAELGVSRFKVARLIDEALSSGLVRVTIGHDGDLDVDLALTLQDHLGLRRALVMREVHGRADERRDKLGSLAARWLQEELSDGDVLGIPWSRTIAAMVRSLTWLPRVEVVQLCGAQPTAVGDPSAVEVVVEAARLAGTRGHVFYAPQIVDDAPAARALLRQSQVRDALEACRLVTTAVVGLGTWAPGTSTIYDQCTPADRAEVSSVGAVGELAGIFFDAQGRIVYPQLAQRLVTVSARDLQAIPDLTAVVSGVDKLEAVRAALAGQLVHGLIVDTPLARALLEH